MSKGKDLAKNTAIVSIGKICTQLITFFLLPVYTAVLSNEEYGVVDLLNTLTSLLLPIATLQIEQGIFRYLLDCRENKEKQTTLITTVSKFILVQSAICILIFLCASPFIHNEYKYFLMANLLMGILSSISLQICRGLGDNKTYAVGSFITGALTVILNVIFIVAFKWGAYGMLIATAISNLLCAIYVFVKKKIYKYIDIKQNDKKLLKDIVKYSVPLIPNMISWWIVSASDRTIISAVIGVAQNGIYSAANKFSGIFSTLYSVFNLTWTESASININSEDRDEFFSKIFDFIVRFFGSLCLGTIAVMPFVFGILVNEKFAESYYQIPILILGSVFNILVSFLGSVYVAKKLTKEIAKTSIIAAIINIVVNIALINQIGLYAASISTVIAYFAMFIYRWIDVKKYVSIKINKTLIAVLSVSFLVAIITYYLKMKIISIVVLLAVIIIAICINKDSAKYLTEIVKKRFKK
jgi:O-antigen/teichoic acid export membrane protein